MRSLLALFLITSPYAFGSSTDAAQTPIEQQLDLPWLTGPLIAPTPTALTKGHYNLEPYLYVTTTTGIYDSDWHAESISNLVLINPALYTYWGLTEWMDIQIDPQIVYNIRGGESSLHFGDLLAGFDFQIIDPGKWAQVPGIKLAILESFPIGKYKNFDPDKKGTQLSGTGSYTTQLELVFYKVVHIKDKHYLSMTLSFEGSIPSPVWVKGFNTYGGGYGAKGKVFPGVVYEAILSFEFTFNEHFVFAIDNVYTHQNKTRFSGDPGTLATGAVSSNKLPSTEQLSFAPALEYNFNSNLGLIFGAWFTAAGRNSAEFRSGIVALNYIH